MTNQTSLRIAIIVVISIILLIILLIGKKLSGLLKDQSIQVDANKPFSLSRTLLCLWTLLIIFGFCYIGLATGSLPHASTSTIALLGIAAGASLIGRTVDRSQAATNPPASLIQNDVTEGFLLDILSDTNGISIARLQTVCFNLIYAGLFVSTIIQNTQLADFDATTLGLLGVSSGTYAALKTTEVK